MWNIYKRTVFSRSAQRGWNETQTCLGNMKQPVSSYLAPSQGTTLQCESLTILKRVFSLKRQDKQYKEWFLKDPVAEQWHGQFALICQAQRLVCLFIRPSCPHWEEKVIHNWDKLLLSAHWWDTILQHCSSWLPLAIIFIPFSQLVPCLHDMWK